MQNKKNQFTNSIIKDRIEVIENSENKLIFRTFLEPNGGQNQLHYHSKLDESFKIVKGELTIIINNIEKKITSGAHYLIKQRTNHMFLNKSSELVIFDVEVTNPKKMINGLKIIYGLTNDGKTTKTGLPKNIFHIAISLKMMDAFSPKIPYFIQKPGISLIAILGRVLGIEKLLIKKYCY